MNIYINTKYIIQVYKLHITYLMGPFGFAKTVATKQRRISFIIFPNLEQN